MDVLFAVMPFADVGRPAMGVSLLKAEIQAAGFQSTIQYFNLELAERIGEELYNKIANSLPPELMAGEWFFADDVFADSIPSANDYLNQILLPMVGSGGTLIQDLMEARKARSEYLEECARQIGAAAPRIVGFTTTFHQTCACLALARRLKQSPNPPVIVFGGANCEADMGLQMLESFPWIDYVCCGESDLSFPALLEQLLRGGPPAPTPGVLTRGVSKTAARSEAIQEMDRLPLPDFDEYFRALENSPLAGKVEAQLIFETSRGCWWGAKHHCTFCGLNGDTMVFRSKSPERAFAEIEYLTERHKTQRIGCVDNILDMRYIDTLFPKLAESTLNLKLFYEVKANLRYDQLVKLRNGGMQQIQPGIESFSNQVLKLMDKGCTGFQNIQLLRWCEELGIDPSWNLLAGFPGESPAEYDKMAQLIPLLTHLAPPCSCAPIRLDRFSPFHNRAEAFGFHRVRPARAYYYVFPLGRRELARLAYFFDYDSLDGRQTDEYIKPVRREIQHWWDARLAAAGDRAKLDAHFENGRVIVEDTRAAAVAPKHELAGLAAKVFAQCDVSTSFAALARLPESAGNDAALRETIDTLLKQNLMAESDGHYLTLPVFRNRPPKGNKTSTDAHLHIPQATPAESLFRLV